MLEYACLSVKIHLITRLDSWNKFLNLGGESQKKWIDLWRGKSFSFINNGMKTCVELAMNSGRLFS